MTMVRPLTMVEQNANKDKIINTLRSFGIEISTIKATVGPTVTLYEITPEQGRPHFEDTRSGR